MWSSVLPLTFATCCERTRPSRSTNAKTGALPLPPWRPASRFHACLLPSFQDAEAAREWLEALLWPDGTICPHCGLIGAAYTLRSKTQRPGLYKCKGCDQQFTVTIGTVFERSHIPLNKWLFASQLMAASKKGVSAHQVHRMLSVTYKTAWFMCHRIREALTTGFAENLGGENKVVEIDETYVGGSLGLSLRRLLCRFSITPSLPPIDQCCKVYNCQIYGSHQVITCLED